MPELPEVETVRRGLMQALDGAMILNAKTYRANLRYPFPVDLVQQIVGRRVLRLERRAKYLLLQLSGNLTLISHLGMSGAWRVENAIVGHDYLRKSQSTVHDHFAMVVEQQGKKPAHIVYNDPRRFGFLLLCERAKLDTHPMLAKLGIEPMADQLSGAFLQQKFKAKNTTLKAALLDQKTIAGLGNIYVCEALWRSQLSPFRKASSLATSDKKSQVWASQLAQNICQVIDEAILAGGSSLRDYKHTDGSLGYFQTGFAVYDCAGYSCPRCHDAPIVRVVQNGRSTFYCEKCQI